jgi:hypothetical protein
VWLARIAERGTMSSSFVPPEPIRRLRPHTRYRRHLTQARTAEKQRAEKLLEGTYEGNREYVTQLRRTAERRQALEDRHPELAGGRRPVLAHEGRFESAPLRAGDHIPVPPGSRNAI